MPTKLKTDEHGSYYQWGDSGKKYRFTKGNKEAAERAKKKADAQGEAIYASGYKGE